jgi:hypothetical protein
MLKMGVTVALRWDLSPDELQGIVPPPARPQAVGVASTRSELGLLPAGLKALTT